MNSNIQLIHGNSIEVLKTIPENSVDSAVTDPPYELGFMGRRWDSSGIAYNVELWRQVLRVLKPGAHIAAFGGTRTYHRMACAIEDAGFDVRDQMAWCYGSGFPKSMDVARAIDAADKIGMSRERSLRFTAWMRQTGLTAKDINAATASCMGSHYLTEKEQPEVATEDMFSVLRPLILGRGNLIPPDIEYLVLWRTVESENLKRRKVIGTKEMIDLTKVRPVSLAAQGMSGSPTREVNITEAHTEAAKLWEGWGTALKPAWEPICLARKPFKGNVAENVLKHGTSALNIGGSRIPFTSEEDEREAKEKNQHEQMESGPRTNEVLGVDERERSDYDANGRWPANILHDGSAEVVECFPDDGFASASRFFYTAKASTEDREAGLFEAQIAEVAKAEYCLQNHNGQKRATGKTRRNSHPTVKPTDLMVWLVRLLTPRGGTVIDPFMGSGSTGRGAAICNAAFIGIDMTAEFLPIARARIDDAVGPLFTNNRK